MKNLIDVLKQKERDSENIERQLENMQRAFENVQREIDVLRSALQLCAEDQPETAVQETVRNRAYELYAQRGHRDGFDREDWLRAEAETLGAFIAAPERCPNMAPASLN